MLKLNSSINHEEITIKKKNKKTKNKSLVDQNKKSQTSGNKMKIMLDFKVKNLIWCFDLNRDLPLLLNF